MSIRPVLPGSLRECIIAGLVVGVIQFGSSLTRRHPNDRDLAVIVRAGRIEDFLALIRKEEFWGIDISLIREEELGDIRHFRYGSHGPHIVLAFAAGRTLYGKNPFQGIKVSREAVLGSILLRLYDYMYEVRKAPFREAMPASIEARWPKFVRLCLLFLDRSLQFPKVLDMPDEEVAIRWRRHGVRLSQRSIISSHEAVWHQVINSASTRRYLRRL